MNRIIEITVSPTGETKIETKGFTGSSCQQASRFIEQALGQQVGEKLTCEYYQQPVTQQQQENKA